MSVARPTRDRLTAIAAGFACSRFDRIVARMIDRGQRVVVDPQAPEVASLRRRLKRETEQIEAERAEGEQS